MALTPQDLLVEQLVAVGRVLELNQAIAKSLDGFQHTEQVHFQHAEETPRAAAQDDTKAVLVRGMSLLKPSPAASQASLRAPLLAGGPTDDWQVAYNPGQALSAQSSLASAGFPPPPLPLASKSSQHSFESADVSPLRDRSPTDAMERQIRSYVAVNMEERRVHIEASLRAKRVVLQSIYHDHGWAQWAIQHSYFKFLTCVMILLNAVWIGIDTDYNNAPVLCQAPLIFQVVDNAFCVFFTMEIFIKLAAFRRTWDTLSDPWLIFNLLLVASMIWETWVEVVLFLYFDIGGSRVNVSQVFRIFRIVRLSRLARMGRLVRLVPELVVLIKGMAMAVRSVFATILLMVMLIYVFGVMFAQLLGDDEALSADFAGVLVSMNTLMQQLVCGFEHEMFERLLSAGLVYYLMLLAFFLFGSLTMMNMLIGVVCEVVTDVSTEAKDERFTKDVKEQLGHIVQGMDLDGNGIISEDEFCSLMAHQDAIELLAALGVDVLGFLDYCFAIFHHCKDIPNADFFAYLTKFASSKSATARDVAEMRIYVSKEFDFLEERLTANALHLPAPQGTRHSFEGTFGMVGS